MREGAEARGSQGACSRTEELSPRALSLILLILLVKTALDLHCVEGSLYIIAQHQCARALCFCHVWKFVIQEDMCVQLCDIQGRPHGLSDCCCVFRPHATHVNQQCIELNLFLL